MKFTWKEILSTTFLILIISSIFAYAAIQSEVGLNVYDEIAGIWRRVTEGSTNGDGVPGDSTGPMVVQSFPMGYDTLNNDWDRIAAGTDSTDNQAVDDGNNRRSMQSLARLTSFDGVTWDRVLNSTHGNDLTTASGINTASFTYFFDGTNWDRAFNTTHADGTGTPTGLNVAGYNYLYNGTTWDRLKTAQTTGINTTATTNTIQHALYAYDDAGASANTYRALQIFNSALRTLNISANINITTNTDTLIDSGTAGRMIFDKLIIGVAGTASQAIIYNEADGAVPCGGVGATIVGTISTLTVQSIDLDIYVGNDICITTSGTAAANLIIAYTNDVN